MWILKINWAFWVVMIPIASLLFVGDIGGVGRDPSGASATGTDPLVFLGMIVSLEVALLTKMHR